MAELLHDDTDKEILRYKEAQDIKQYSGVTIDTLRGGKIIHDPIKNVEAAYVDLPSGGTVRIGERPVTPAQAVETDMAAQAQEGVVAATSASPVQPNGRPLIESIIGGENGPQLEDYLAAGYTEDEVLQFQQWDATQTEQQMIARGDLFPNTLDQAQLDQLSQIPGAEMVQERAPGLRGNMQDMIYNALDPNREPSGPVGEMFSSALRMIVPDSANLDAGDLRFWSNLLTDFADVTAPGVGGSITIDEGAREFNYGSNLLADGIAEGDMGKIETGLISSVIGAGITTLGVAEMVPLVGELAGSGADALRKLQPATKNLLADAIGASRALSRGDKELLGEIFQPRGTPRSLGAAGVGDVPAIPGSSTEMRGDSPQAETFRNQVREIAAQNNRTNVKIEDLATFFEQTAQNRFGRVLDPTNPEDFDLAVNAAVDEINYQMTQSVSGQGWYDNDIRTTFETLSQVPGLERLATDEPLRVLWSAIAGPTSIGNKVDMNGRAATAALLQYLRNGKVPTTPPAAGAVTEGIRGAGWGRKQASVAANMRVISHLVDELGLEGFADWWLSPHSLSELTSVRKAAGLSGGPSGLSGGKDSMHLGAMVIGDKTGRYSLNINGYEGTTKDVWFSRSYNRLFGDMRDASGEIVGGPRNQTERRRMEEFVSEITRRVDGGNMSEQDAQAILWFYEQNLYTDLGVPSRPGSFSQAAERIANDFNVRPGLRTGDAAQAEGGQGLEGYRSVSATQRTVRAERRLSERLDRADPEGQAGPYSREAGQGDARDGLLTLTPQPGSVTRYQSAGLNLPSIVEVPTSDAAQYNADMTSAMAGHTFGAQVEIKSAEELSGARLFRTENGSGFAIKPDGDVVAVFAGPNEAPGSGYAMLQAAVAAGGRKLDAFDTYLPKIYETVGFRPVARLPWNDEFAPPNWDKQVFSEFNNGEPDVVFFVYDPSYYGGAVDIPTFTDYDAAVAEQDRQLSLIGQ